MNDTQALTTSSAAPPPSVAPPPVAPPSAAQLRVLLAQLGHGLLERDSAVHLALLAALAGEHVLLIGPPGTAKSALARRLHAAFAGTRWFERLLTRFSTPEELFGPLSLKALEEDRYERLTDGFLPSAGIVFLDEVFKANSAILNALLTLLNEREFDNGTSRLRVPLVCVVAASNEVPSDDALRAFYDRFLLRVPVAPVGDAAFVSLLALPASAAHPGLQPLHAQACAALREQAAHVDLGEGFVSGCQALRGWLAVRQTGPTGMSDRRWRQFVTLCRVAAAAEGRTLLDELDLWLAPWVALHAPEDEGPLLSWFEDDWLQSPPAAAPWLERATQAFEKQLDLEQSAPGDEADDTAGKLALARAIGLREAGPGGELESGEETAPRWVFTRLEDQLRRRYSNVHVQARVAQLTDVELQLSQHLAQAQATRNALDARLADRLWWPQTLRARVLGRHDALIHTLSGLATRLARTRIAFAALPQRESEDGAALAPAPVQFEPVG